MKKLVVNLNQTINGKTSAEQFTVNVLDNAEQFSGKMFRKLFARAANKVLSLDGKLLSISKGRRFTMSIEFEGLQISNFSAFYNSSELIQNKFNRELKARLEAAIVDIKDLLSE